MTAHIDWQDAVCRYLTEHATAQAVTITAAKLLSGGAIQENWALDLVIDGGPYAGQLAVVLRCDSASAVSVSHGRAEEYALLRAAFDAGVTVPEPLWLCADRAVMGRPFFVMRRINGTATAHQVVKSNTLGGNRRELAERLGEELARIHSIVPGTPGLAFLPVYEQAPALYHVQRFREFLDGHHSAHPVLEFGLNWLERHAPARAEVTLTHGDFRTGNYMVDEQGLTGVLDWEFAGWSDPMQDLGWFCAKCWRFSRPDLAAGGIGAREDFYRGYSRVSGRQIDPVMVQYWEVMAFVNWAIISLQQAQRHVSGEEVSLLLGLTGHITPELEWEILQMTEAD